MSYSHNSYSQSPSSKSQSPPSTTSQKQYPTAHATSSAFSASANANEDWTKISDLAERRRIQNRIAQRNYRKKLKKRLEDLEKRAGSSSASPEQSPQQLADHEPEELPRAAPNTTRASRRRPDHSPQLHGSQPSYVLSSGTDDRGMFAQQYTRQLSTSPPPFSSYATSATLPTTTMDGGYQPYSLHQPQHLPAAYCNTGAGLDMPLYPHYMASMGYPHPPQPAIKQEYYGDDESSPFSIGYASMAAGGSGSGGPAAASSYHDVPAYVSSNSSRRPAAPASSSAPPYPPYHRHLPPTQMQPHQPQQQPAPSRQFSYSSSSSSRHPHYSSTSYPNAG